MRKRHPKAWRQAHQRLYEYYKALPEKELPDTPEEMEPLVAAIAHGCSAGLCQQAFDEIYWKRIQRQEERYLIYTHGAYGIDIMSLVHFFEITWTKPSVKLDERAQITVLNNSGFALRAVGRLYEAMEPLRTGLEEPWVQKFLCMATISACNLSHLNINLGNFKVAQKISDFAVRNSKTYPEKIWDTASLTTLGDSLHQVGKLDAAKDCFLEAEKIHIQRYDGVRILHAMQEYRFCNLLCSLGDYCGAEKRAIELLKLGFNQKSLLYRALTFLSLGITSQIDKLKNTDHAVDLLRQASHDEFLPHGLLARSALLIKQSNFDAALTDLKEVHEIAAHSNMLPHLTDSHLEAARLSLAMGGTIERIILDKTAENAPVIAKDHIKIASRLIDKTGYDRRKPDLALVRARLAIARGEQEEARCQLDIASGYVDEGWKIHEVELAELTKMLLKI